VLNRFMSYYHDMPSDYYDEYKKRSFVIGKDVKVISGDSVVSAHVLDLDEECGLVVRYEDGTEEVLRSGEISIRV